MTFNPLEMAEAGYYYVGSLRGLMDLTARFGPIAPSALLVTEIDGRRVAFANRSDRWSEIDQLSGVKKLLKRARHDSAVFLLDPHYSKLFDVWLRYYRITGEYRISEPLLLDADFLRIEYKESFLLKHIQEEIRSGISQLGLTVDPGSIASIRATKPAVEAALQTIRIPAGYEAEVSSIELRSTGIQSWTSLNADDAGINLTIFTSGSPEQGRRIRDAALSLAESFGLVPTELGEEYSGSFWQRVTLKTKLLSLNPDVRLAARQVLLGLQNAGLNSLQATIDGTKASSIAALIDSTREVDEVVIILGTLVFVKYQGRIVARSIDAVRASILESNEYWFKSPKRMMELMQNDLEDAITPEIESDPENRPYRDGPFELNDGSEGDLRGEAGTEGTEPCG